MVTVMVMVMVMVTVKVPKALSQVVLRSIEYE